MIWMNEYNYSVITCGSINERVIWADSDQWSSQTDSIDSLNSTTQIKYTNETFCRCTVRFKRITLEWQISSLVWAVNVRGKACTQRECIVLLSGRLALSEHTTGPRGSPRVKLWAHGRITAIDHINRTTTPGQKPESARFLDSGLACPLPFSSPDPSASGQGFWQASRQKRSPAPMAHWGPSTGSVLAQGPAVPHQWSSREGSMQLTQRALNTSRRLRADE